MLMLMPKLQVPAVESEAESVTLRTQLMVQKGVHLGVPRAGVFKTSHQLFILTVPCLTRQFILRPLPILRVQCQA